MKPATDPPTILFDGVCSLCGGWVRFVLAHESDREPRVRFAALQSEPGAALARVHGIDPERLDSIVFVADGVAWQHSDAVMQMLRHLRAPWRWGRIGRILPRGFRDWCYRLVARNRYRLFGKTDTCMVPTSELRSRFLL